MLHPFDETQITHIELIIHFYFAQIVASKHGLYNATYAGLAEFVMELI